MVDDEKDLYLYDIIFSKSLHDISRFFKLLQNTNLWRKTSKTGYYWHWKWFAKQILQTPAISKDKKSESIFR